MDFFAAETGKQLRNIVETIPDGVIFLDLHGHMTLINAAAERILCIARDDFIGKHYDALGTIAAVDGDASPSPQRAFSVTSFVEAGIPLYGVEHALEREGARIILSVNAAPLFADDGVLIGLATSFVDITERKKAEQTLKESEQKYRRLVDTANDAIFVADIATGKIIDANQRAAELIGRPVEKIIGMHQTQLHPPEDAASYRTAFQEYVSKGQGVARDLFICHADGRKIPVEISASLTEIAGKKILQGIFRDMTESKRLEEERRRSKQLSDALNNINAAMNSTLDFRQIMEGVVVESTEAVGSETGVIYLRESDEWTIRHVHKLPVETVGLSWSDEEAPLLSLTARTRSPIVSNDVLNDERFDRELMEKHGTRSLLSVPLVHREEVIGVLLFENHTKAVPFAEPEVDFANKLAAAVSLSVENARLYAAQRNVAHILQQALLALPKDIQGVDFGYLYRSATEAAEVGGDFYDLFELDSGQVAITVGDVSGKGLEAASLTSLVKNTIRAYAYHDPSPAWVIAKTSEVVARSVEPANFVTAFFGILDTTSGKLKYCSAGHPEAIIRRPTGIAHLETSSPAIGAFTGLEFKEERAHLDETDILVLYTDGVTEARCDKRGFFGEERLADCVAGLKRPTAKTVPEAIFQEILHCRDCALTDDVVIVALSPCR